MYVHSKGVLSQNYVKIVSQSVALLFLHKRNFIMNYYSFQELNCVKEEDNDAQTHDT